MKRVVTLQSLTNRILMDREFIEKHPENAELINKHMEKQKEYIVECALKNSGNSILEQIIA